MSVLYRAMKADGDRPLVAGTGRTLGVRREGEYADVMVDGQGYVHPGGGMSATPDDPLQMRNSRKPRNLGGQGKDPLWVIPEEKIVSPLKLVLTSTTHAQIEPESRMPLEEYEAALAALATDWEAVP